MSPSVEYLVVSLILVVTVLTFSTQLLPSMLVRTAYVSETTLQTEAEKIVDQLLLNPGDPPDWGVNAVCPSDIRVLGLASSQGGPYELDANKLIRIYESSVGNLTGFSQLDLDSVAKLLGIYGKYGFSIRITPVLNVSVRARSENSYEVSVKTHEQLPVANAKVRGLLIVPRVEGNAVIYYVEEAEAYTGYDGRVLLNLTTGVEGVGRVLSVYVDFYGIKNVAITEISGSTGYGVIVGNSLYVGHIEGVLNETGVSKRGGGAIHLRPEALVIITPESIDDIILTEGKLLPITPNLVSARPYYKFELEGVERGVVAVLFVVKNQGRYMLVVAKCVYNNLQVGVPLISTSHAARGVHVRRIVNISGFYYYFDFTLWRVVEEG